MACSSHGEWGRVGARAHMVRAVGLVQGQQLLGMEHERGVACPKGHLHASSHSCSCEVGAERSQGLHGRPSGSHAVCRELHLSRAGRSQLVLTPGLQADLCNVKAVGGENPWLVRRLHLRKLMPLPSKQTAAGPVMQTAAVRSCDPTDQQLHERELGASAVAASVP